MTSRSERLRVFLDANGPFEGSVADLAVEMDDASPNALSACVSVAIKEGWLRRHPETGGAKAEWLWLATQQTPNIPLVETEPRDGGPDPATVEAEPEPVVESAPAPIEPIIPSEPAPLIEPQPIVEGPSPMRITIDVAPWQIRVDGKALTVREAKALIRDLQTALSVVEP